MNAVVIIAPLLIAVMGVAMVAFGSKTDRLVDKFCDLFVRA